MRFLIAKSFFDRHAFFVQSSQPQRRSGLIRHQIKCFRLRALNHNLLEDRIFLAKFDILQDMALAWMNNILAQQTDMLSTANLHVRFDPYDVIEPQLLTMPGQIGFAEAAVGQNDDPLAGRQETLELSQHLTFEATL